MVPLAFLGILGICLAAPALDHQQQHLPDPIVASGLSPQPLDSQPDHHSDNQPPIVPDPHTSIIFGDVFTSHPHTEDRSSLPELTPQSDDSVEQDDEKAASTDLDESDLSSDSEGSGNRRRIGFRCWPELEGSGAVDSLDDSELRPGEWFSINDDTTSPVSLDTEVTTTRASPETPDFSVTQPEVSSGAKPDLTTTVSSEVDSEDFTDGGVAQITGDSFSSGASFEEKNSTGAERGFETSSDVVANEASIGSTAEVRVRCVPVFAESGDEGSSVELGSGDDSDDVAATTEAGQSTTAWQFSSSSAPTEVSSNTEAVSLVPEQGHQQPIEGYKAIADV